MKTSSSTVPVIEVGLATSNRDSESDCLCGIPECKGHEDLGGYIAVPTLLAELFLGAPERDFTPRPPLESPIPAKAEGGESNPASLDA